jgi:hypothetical protein
MIGKPLPKLVELSRLQRLKDAVLGSEISGSRSRIVTTDDWVADLEARIAELERGLRVEWRNPVS